MCVGFQSSIKFCNQWVSCGSLHHGQWHHTFVNNFFYLRSVHRIAPSVLGIHKCLTWDLPVACPFEQKVSCVGHVSLNHFCHVVFLCGPILPVMSQPWRNCAMFFGFFAGMGTCQPNCSSTEGETGSFDESS
jgi:hypothetical protein